LKKFLHDWIGVGAAGLVVAALVYFLSPWLETVLGPERTKTLQLVLLSAFAIYAAVYFVRFLGVVTRKKE
jgi:MFS-type transporter involved in bile tolerance (Atg22 family)